MPRHKRPRLLRIVLIVSVLAALLAVLWMSSTPDPAPASPSVENQGPVAMTVRVLETMPHDPEAYTQGLVWYDGDLYESTGQYGRSTLRHIRPATGEVVTSRALAPDLFGEGLARIEDRLIQLTWQRGEALIWSIDGLEELDRLLYSGEGWGLCFDGRHLVMSDGSSVLAFRDPDTFEVVREVEVRLRDGAVGRLNELECVEGWIYANVYTTDWIVKIEPQSGRVESLIDASGLLTGQEAKGAEVLNGIAFDGDREVFYLTGKLWPKLFAVQFVEVDSR